VLFRVLRSLRDAPLVDEKEIKIAVRYGKKEPTERETEVLKALSHGLTSKEMSVVLGISEHTINVHVRRLQMKLKAKNRMHLVARGFREGIIT
jgi:DNA-binding CsgD family transcriptional regulator